MTAALGCFDTERRERDPALTFSITFHFRNRNSPIAAFPLQPRAPPTDSCNPPSTPSSTSSACSDLSTQGRTAGAFTPTSQPAPTALGFHSPKHVVFTLSGMPKVHSLRSGVGGRARRSGVNVGRTRREAGLPWVSSGSPAWQPALFMSPTLSDKIFSTHSCAKLSL